jgi:protein-S-isoprenylcysteine O-methyltransferase Ste14
MVRLPIYAVAVVYAGLIVWLVPFILTGWSKKQPQKRDARWRWGIVMEVAAYVLLWFGHHGSVAVSTRRMTVAVFCFVLASLLSWTATRSLGRFLRFEAALDTDHQLVRNGPYRIVRHPIYASMLCMFLGMAAMAATPLSFAVALVLFLAGTEVRVRVEDRLLADHFGDQFREYQRTTRAYIPLLR